MGAPVIRERQTMAASDMEYRSPVHFPLNSWCAILFLVVLSIVVTPVACAEVLLSTPQSDYYSITGEEVMIPLSISSSYGHDITGTLQLSMVPVNPTASAGGSSGASLQSRTFSAFTEERTVRISAGSSDNPADYALTITFRYNVDGGGRVATLGDIDVHFVTSLENVPANNESIRSTDSNDTTALVTSSGAPPEENPGDRDPGSAIRNSQLPQDTSVLREQMTDKGNRSDALKEELLAYILTDPLVASLSGPLSGDGFAITETEVDPLTNRSGSFEITYVSGAKNAMIRGSVADARVLFAEESARVPIPLPGALESNNTFRDYVSTISGRGFVHNQTRINVTASSETVDLGYAGAGSRILHLKATVVNGTVVAIEGNNPDDPLYYVIPAIGILLVILISAGIWYLAWLRQKTFPPGTLTADRPETPETYRQIALAIVTGAESDAAGGRWPEAYRKIGRALRVFLSHEIGSGEELTTGELERLIGPSTGDPETIRGLLERSVSVGFAKDRPDPEEFREIVRSVRTLMGRETDRSGERAHEGVAGNTGDPPE